MSVRAFTRRAARDAKRETATNDLFAMSEIASAAKTFLQTIHEAREALAYLERRGIPAIFPLIIEDANPPRRTTGSIPGVDAQGPEGQRENCFRL